MPLEKIERNSLYEAIVKAGLDPIEFEVDMDEQWPGLRHASSGSYFLVHEGFWKTSRFGIRSVVSHGRVNYFKKGKWSHVLALADYWCAQIKVPDLWRDVEIARDVLESSDDKEYDNTPFTSEEQAEILRQLTFIKDTIRQQYALPHETISRIEVKLDEAEMASKRINRKDWLLLFSGTILTLIVTDLVTPDIAHHIFVMAMQGLSHLFRNGHEIPRPLSQSDLP
jgi:hypothetical protein